MVDNDQEDLTLDFTNKLVVGGRKKIIYCDAGYGFPSEAKPRRERVLAVAKQIVNFLIWQGESSMDSLAEIVICDCDQSCRTAVEERMKQLLKGSLPTHVSFSTASLDSLSSQDLVYLSPDADATLDPTKEPPDHVVVGLLVDRRIQPNRSKRQAASLGLPCARLALEAFNMDDCEPLNVDTVLVGMQQWWWNCQKGEEPLQECFLKAMETTMQQHIARHPNRPLHKAIPTQES
ncbi:hypothetical protein MHU86_4143 [Fragilaria crotonensis]|nr:hypothetical protein MHU86_4143 [Fragilaria crotonensis]